MRGLAVMPSRFASDAADCSNSSAIAFGKPMYNPSK